MHQSLDEIVFENRNREYGSYWMRKRYFRGILWGFIVSISLGTLIALGCYWYLNSGGDDSVYLYTSSYPALKSTRGSLMDKGDIAAYTKKSVTPERPKDQPAQKPDALRNFKIVNEAKTDTFKPNEKEQEKPVYENNIGLDIPSDSTVFGGYLMSGGDGGGSGGNLDKFPEFPGGLDKVRRYIELTVTYPVQAVKQKINGVVIISFDVNKQGGVDNIKVERSLHPMCDEEAVKAVRNMPPWKPGMRHGRPVIVKFVIPVRFMPLS